MMKLSQAIQYLRDRNKYVVDKGNTFVPTASYATNIRILFHKARYGG